MVLSFGRATEDKVKRTQYITMVNSRIEGTVHRTDERDTTTNPHRYIYKRNAYYCVVDKSGWIHWYGISGTSSLIKRYKMVSTEERTNVFAFLSNTKGIKDTTNIQNSAVDSAIDSNTTQNSVQVLAFTHSGVYIDRGDKIVYYNTEGIAEYTIDRMLDVVHDMKTTLCSRYLIVQYEKGDITVYDIQKRKYIYKNKYMQGTMHIFGHIFAYTTLIVLAHKSVLLYTLSTGDIQTELTFPDIVVSVTMDILHRRIVVGTETGCIYNVRIDGEESEYTKAKIADSASAIRHLSMSLCGTVLYAVSDSTMYIVSTKDGSVLQRVPARGDTFLFTHVTSSNLHLQ